MNIMESTNECENIEATENVQDDTNPKKARHRKKHLYNSILQLMEFYLSDSNLTKDRFFAQLINENPYINLSVFLKCNKIKKLTSSLDDIRKAISKSDLIELSEDKESVCRKIPVRVKENTDDCTIYVEKLKPDATHDWLSTVFSEFGNVVYISIPKYKRNKLNKGFAFVEFETESEANAALEYFESIGSKMPANTNPEELSSISTYEKEEFGKTFTKEEKNKQDGIKNPNELSVFKIKNEPSKMCTQEQKRGLKISKMMDSESITEELGTRNISEEKNTVDESIDIASGSEKSSKKRKPSKFKDSDETRSDSATEEKITEKNTASENRDKVSSTDGNSRKRKTKIEDCDEIIKETKKIKNEDEINRKDNQGTASESEEMESKKKKKLKKEHKKKNYIKDHGLQILSKKEWKKLRNCYLNLQKKKMGEVKQYLRRRYSKDNIDNKELESVKDENFILKPAEENLDSNSESLAKNACYEKPKLSFLPGLIVKIHFDEPCLDQKKFKEDMKSASSSIQFVDFPFDIESKEVYIRFADTESAQEFVTREDDLGTKQLLKGEEENKYWNKIEESRQKKFNKNIKKKIRGKDKLLKKVKTHLEKEHVFFEDH